MNLWIHKSEPDGDVLVDTIYRVGENQAPIVHNAAYYPRVDLDDKEWRMVASAPAMRVLLNAVASPHSEVSHNRNKAWLRYCPIGWDRAVNVPLFGDLNKSAKTLLEFDPSLGK